MSIKSSYPTDSPSLVLDFANSRRLDPRITFTRAQTGNISSYMGPDGLIKYAGPDQPRFDHKYNSATGEVESLGLLIEESRVNAFDDFNSSTNQLINISSSYLDVTSTSDINPNGSAAVAYTASKTGNPSQYHGFPFGSQTVSSSETFTLSAWVKEFNNTDYKVYFVINARNPTTNNSNYLLRLFSPRTGNWVAGFTTQTVWSNASSSIEEYPNGWYRVSITGTYTFESGRTTVDAGYQLFNELNQQLYDPPTANTHGLFIWGPQYEQGAFPTSYIPTNGSAVTRNSASITLETSSIDFSDPSNNGEGTLICEFTDSDGIGSNISACFSGDLHNGATFLGIGSDSNFNPFIRNRVNTVNYALIGDTNLNSSSDFVKVGYLFSQLENTIITSSNHRDTDSNIQYDNTPYTKMIIGRDQIYTDNNRINGTMKKISYYPIRLSNAQLQELTK